jgi:hypothetical protein
MNIFRAATGRQPDFRLGSEPEKELVRNKLWPAKLTTLRRVALSYQLESQDRKRKMAHPDTR